jgi:hypothetical protein
MKILRKAILTSIGILPFFAPLSAFAADDATDTKDLLSSSELDWRKSRFSLVAESGSRTLGTVDAFVPFMGNEDFMIYADLMAKLGSGASNASGNTFEGNLGLGFRRVNDKETAIYGMYAFYDSLRSVNDNTFQQVTVGAERLGLTWDFRANVYLPLGEKSLTKDVYKGGKVVIDAHNLIEYIKLNTETITTGYDVEVGRTLGTNKLRGYIGAYSFGKDLSGPRMRLEYQLSSHLTLTGSLQHDKDRGTQYLLGARMSVGGSQAENSNSIYNRMTAPVVRDVDIVTKVTETDMTKVELDRFYMVDVDNQANGDGTLENPFNSINDAINAAPENAIIFVVGKNGEPQQLGGDTSLKEGQLLWGGYEPLYWDFDQGLPRFVPNDGDTLLIQSGSGVRQTLSGGITANGNNIGLYHFDLQGNGQSADGVFINDHNGVVVNDVNISGFDTGIQILGSHTDVSLSNIKLDQNGTGILIEGGQTTYSNLSISNSENYGIQMSGGSSLSGDHVEISNSGLDGMHIDNATFSSNSLTINNSEDNGVYQQGGNFNVFGAGAVSNSGKDGMHFENVSFSAGSLMISDSDGYGLFQTGGSFEVLGKTSVSDSKQDGIYFENLDARIGSMSISNSGGKGLYQNGGSLVASGDLIANNSQADGIYLQNVTALVKNISSTEAGMNGLVLNNSELNVTGSLVADNNEASGIVNQASKLRIDGKSSSSENGEFGYYGEHGSLTGSGSLETSANNSSGFFASDSTIELGGLTSNANGQDGVILQDTQATFGSLTAQDNTAGKGLTISGNDKQVSIGMADIQRNTVGIVQHDAALTIDSGNVSNNTQEGIDSYGASLTINDTNFANNGTDGIKLNNGSQLTLDGGNFTDNGHHGLNMTDNNIANISNVSFTHNGGITEDKDGNSIVPDAQSIDDLYSAISVSGTLNANGLIVNNNAAGIELVNGSLNINQAVDNNTSTINDNHGYGIWAHQKQDGTTRNITISNTQITGNTFVNPDVKLLGHGIYAQDINEMHLTDVSMNNNEGIGLSVESGRVALDSVQLNQNNTAGLLVDGGDVSLTDSESIGNGNGIEFTNGKLTITNSFITDNKHLGVLLKSNADGTTRELTMRDSIIEGTKNNNSSINLGQGEGHGLEVDDSNSTVTLFNTQIINNEGHGVYLKAGTFTMDGDDKNSSRLGENGLGGIYALFDSTAPEKSVQQIHINNTTIDLNVKRTDVEGTTAVKINYLDKVMDKTVFMDNVDIIHNNAAGIQFVWTDNNANIYEDSTPTITRLTMNNNDDSNGKSKLIDPMIDHATLNLGQEAEEYIIRGQGREFFWEKREP